MSVVSPTNILGQANACGIRPRLLPNGTQEFHFRFVQNSYLKLLNSAAFGAPQRPFLLASNALTVTALAKLLAACRDDLISIGFALAHAQEYEKVFVIGAFEPALLHERFIANDIEVIYIAAQAFEPLTVAARQAFNAQGIQVAVINGDLNGRDLTACLKAIFANQTNAHVTFFPA